MRRAGRLYFRTAILAWVAILAVMANSTIVSAAPDDHPGTAAAAPSDAAARSILTVQALTINGSSAQSIAILSTENVVIVSQLAGIAFFYDTACSVLNGTVGSPYSDSAINVRADWGSTFSVAPIANTPEQVSDCHQVSIVDPTPTPVPTNTPVPTATPTNTPTNTPSPTSTSTPMPTPTLAPDQISINGSEASPVTALTDGRIRIESASGWIAFYSDGTCSDLSGAERSPLDRASSLYIGLYGTSFSVNGVTESNVPTTTCRQVSIVDPTPTPSPSPTPTPTMPMTINGSSELLVEVDYRPGSDDSIAIEVPKVSGANVIFHMYPGTCAQQEPTDPILRTLAGGGTLYLSESYVVLNGSFPAPGRHELAVYAKRDTDGAQSACQFIGLLVVGEEPPTATPTPPMTPTVPATAPPPTSTAMVTGLPQTGSGSGSPSGLPTIILGTAMALFVAAFGIERRRRHRRASR